MVKKSYLNSKIDEMESIYKYEESGVITTLRKKIANAIIDDEKCMKSYRGLNYLNRV